MTIGPLVHDGRLGVRIAGIATHLPEQILDNNTLSVAFPEWAPEKILEKTGIRERRIASKGETALDLGVCAVEKLITSGVVARDEIDFVIFCTQAPDYFLPTSACLIQSRSGLSKNIGAFDMNLGCSGYVYGIAQAAALIASGLAARVLLVTADTYSKFINDEDRSVRTLFGDGATATLLVPAQIGESGYVGPFVFGTDGAGAQDLIVPAGGARLPRSDLSATEHSDEYGNVRSMENLYMNGGAVLNFTLREVPILFEELKKRSGLGTDDFDYFVLHQANRFMLDALIRKLKIPREKTPYAFEWTGNTVSSSIPFALEEMTNSGTLKKGDRLALLGFGVGLSWAGGVLAW